MVIHLQVGAAVLTVAATALCCWGEGSVTEHGLTPADGIPLALAVFLVMWDRGSNPEKSAGYAAAKQPTGLLAAHLQNTVEQTLLAVIAVASYAAAAPSAAAGVLDGAGWLFVIGRALFLLGYWLAPMWRFYGFALNYYTSVALLFASAWYRLGST
jgi:hypothetical protein